MYSLKSLFFISVQRLPRTILFTFQEFVSPRVKITSSWKTVNHHKRRPATLLDCLVWRTYQGFVPPSSSSSVCLHVIDVDAVGDLLDFPDGVQVQQRVAPAPGEDVHVGLVGHRDIDHLGVPALLVGEEPGVEEGRHLLGHVFVEVAHPRGPAPDLGRGWLVIKLY